jgi:hypothetical protein
MSLNQPVERRGFFRRSQASFSATFAPPQHAEHLSELLKRHVAPYDSLSLLGPIWVNPSSSPTALPCSRLSTYYLPCFSGASLGVHLWHGTEESSTTTHRAVLA